MTSFQLQSFVLSFLLVNAVKGSTDLCSFGDIQCMSINEKFFYGPLLKTFNVSADPFYQATVSQVTEDFSYTMYNLTLAGLSKCEVSKVVCNTSDQTFVLILLCDELELNCDFKCNGTIDTYEVEGTGQFRIIQEHYTIYLSGSYETYVASDGETYIYKPNYSVNVDPLGISKFEILALYTGNEENFTLANEYLNSNCLLGEKLFRKPFLSILRKFFGYYNNAEESVPVAKLFPAI